MAIKKYNTIADYQSALKSDRESDISLVSAGNEVMVDGVNVVVETPELWDVVYVDDTKKVVFIKRATFTPSLLPNTWKYVGVVFDFKGEYAKVLWGNNFDSVKYLDVSQFAWTDAVLDGAEHSKTIGLRFGLPNWDTTTSITFTYTATTLAEAAAACQAAIEAKLTELSASAATIAEWWAYADTENSRVIVQRDNCTDYRFYNCSGLTHISWGDMPATSANILKADGKTTQYRGVMNVSGAVSYWSTNGRVPTAQVPAHISGNDNPVKKADFDSNQYCDLLRAEYGDYTTYIRECFKIEYPQKFSCFADSFDAYKLTQKYGIMTAPKKAGGTKPKFPALNKVLTYGYTGVSGVDKGDMYLWGAHEGIKLLSNEGSSLFNAIQSKVGKSTLSNSSYRWFAQRYGVGYAWIFGGNPRMLHTSYVSNASQVGAVSLLKIK